MTNKKRILILGKNSYVGCSFKKYIDEYFYDMFEIDSFRARDDQWKKIDFSKYYSTVNSLDLQSILTMLFGNISPVKIFLAIKVSSFFCTNLFKGLAP